MLFANSIAYRLHLLDVVRLLRLHLILEMLDFTLQLPVFVFLSTQFPDSLVFEPRIQLVDEVLDELLTIVPELRRRAG